MWLQARDVVDVVHQQIELLRTRWQGSSGVLQVKDRLAHRGPQRGSVAGFAGARLLREMHPVTAAFQHVGQLGHLPALAKAVAAFKCDEETCRHGQTPAVQRTCSVVKR